MPRIELPEFLYHGTVIEEKNFREVVSRFRNKLLDTSKWKSKRDFGKGFYVTGDLAQAKAFAIRKAQQLGLHKYSAVVLQISCDTSRLTGSLSQRIFFQTSREWSDYILSNRVFGKDIDEVHDIIIGPTADNVMEDVVKAFIDCNQLHDPSSDCAEVFYHDITEGPILHQIVFKNEKAEPMLQLAQYAKYSPVHRNWNTVSFTGRRVSL